jgi:hypothetical protein
VQIDVKLKTIYIGFGIFGSFLPPLGLFSKTNSFSYLYVKTLGFGKSKCLSKLVLIKSQKLPLFPIIRFLPHKRVVFAIRGF